jgi:hypothetical protein
MLSYWLSYWLCRYWLFWCVMNTVVLLLRRTLMPETKRHLKTLESKTRRTRPYTRADHTLPLPPSLSLYLASRVSISAGVRVKSKRSRSSEK